MQDNWMQDRRIGDKATLVPVGSNVSAPSRSHKTTRQVPVIIVFGVTENNPAELDVIAQTVLGVAQVIGKVQLILFGRGSEMAERLHEPLRGTPVDLKVCGRVSFEEAGALFATADVQLFVRYGVSSRRGTAVAGIASGLPIVGFTNYDTAFPITEAGVRLVPQGDIPGLVRELLTILHDDAVRAALAERSRNAYERYFSWERIAEKYIAASAGTSADSGERGSSKREAG